MADNHVVVSDWDIRDPLDVRVDSAVHVRKHGERVEVEINVGRIDGLDGPAISDEEVACVLLNLSYHLEKVVEENHPAVAARAVRPRRIWDPSEDGG